MSKQIIIAEKNHIAAVFTENQVQELVVATGSQQVGDIYLGKIENVVLAIDAAFVNIGGADKNGFIHVSDLGPLRLRKTSGAITELLSPQQPVLVQVMKEPTSNKGPRLTGNISLPGRYLVLMPYGRGVSLSRRIKNEAERNRLRALCILSKPPGMGLLVRTEAEGKAEENILEDLDFLQKQWDKIQQEANTVKAPSLLNRDEDFIQRVLRDMYSDEVDRIVVDSDNSVKRVKKQLHDWNASRHPQGVVIECHQGYTPILDHFRISSAIKEALKPRVDLPSGGYIVIEPTEALTVVDVNSGSFTHSATSRETVSWTNTEAATEIARQLKLRNIGGVIIVDFIDMDSRQDKLKLIEHFNRVLKGDKAAPQIAQLSELGLVELTRKRQGQNIYELFGQTCSHCGGLGIVANLPGQSAPLNLNSYGQPVIINKGVEKPVIDEKPVISIAETPPEEEVLEPQNGRRRRRLDEPKEESVLTNGKGNKGNQTDSKPERKERSYLPQRTSHRDETILEKVIVEMTEAEQDIYAMMGVSPLVHLGREIKDPKSVLVYVQNPTENGNQTVETKAEEDTVIFSSEENIDHQPNSKDELPKLSLEDRESLEQVEEEYTEIEDDEETIISPEEVEAVHIPSEPQTIAEMVVEEALKGDRPVVRARRRRGAKVTENSEE